MSRLNWITTFEKVDKDTLQECHSDREHGLLHRGKIIKLCEVCKQWVSEHDYIDFCQQGYHEYSIPCDKEVLDGLEVGKKILETVEPRQI